MVKKTKDMTEKVMKEIEEKGIKMRPRVYFIVGSLLLGVGLAGAMILAVFFVNLAVFKFRVQAPLGFLWLGRFGLRPFLQNTPWQAGLLALGGIAGGLFLLKKYDIAYRKNFLVLALSLIGLTVALGLVLSRAGFNERAGRARLMHSLYQHQFVGRDWVMGKVIEVKENEVEILAPDGKKLTIVWDESTRWPFKGKVATGEAIRAVGKCEGEVLQAQGIVSGRQTWQRWWLGRDSRTLRPLQP